MGAVGGSALSSVIFMPGDVSSPLADRLEGPAGFYIFIKNDAPAKTNTAEVCVPSLQVSWWTGVSLRAAAKTKQKKKKSILHL